MTSCSGGRRSIQLSYGRGSAQSRCGRRRRSRPTPAPATVGRWTFGRLPRHRGLGAHRAPRDGLPAGARGRRPPAVRLRRGLAAPDAALDRARGGGRDLPDPLPRRPLPRGARACSRPMTSRAASARCGSSARPGSRELFKALGRIVGRLSYEVELVELDEGEAVRHDGYEVRSLRGRPSGARLRLRAGRGRAAGALRPGARRAARGRARPRLRQAPGRRARAAARTARSARAGDGGAQARPQDRRHRRHGAMRDAARRRARGRAARARRELRRRGDRAGRRDRPLDRPPGG